MRKKFAARELLVVALTVGFAVGCASTPEEEPAPEPEPETQEQTGPTQATVQAINDARAALDSARAAGCEDWQSIADTISDAEAAGAEGNDAEAQRLARQATRAAEECERQAQATMTYTVVRGDNLWNISAKSNVYGNPYQWPLIYKRNSGKIEDADLIYPGQDFTIDKNPSQGAVDAAVEHARTRGSWSLGTVEQSDKDYLAGR